MQFAGELLDQCPATQSHLSDANSSVAEEARLRVDRLAVASNVTTS
jgi:hypothetical protein